MADAFIDFARAALVVPHPDDEVLWFSSVLNRVARVFICFLDATHPDFIHVNSGRREALKSYPLKNVECLGLTESRAAGTVDWSSVRLTRCGVKSLREDRDYCSNFVRLCEILEDRLKSFAVVFTSSPWGEYGHEEHVLVNRAVKRVKKTHGFDLWYPGYAGRCNRKLKDRVMRGINSAHIRLPIQKALVVRLKDHYDRHDCWTFHEGYRFPGMESFIKDSKDRSGRKSYVFNEVPF